MRTIGTYLYAEFLKTKRNKGLHLVYILPIVFASIALYVFIRQVPDMNNVSDPNNVFFYQIYGRLYCVVSPLIIALLMFSVLQIENNNKAWENCFLLPLTKSKLYVSKLLMISLITITYVLISWLAYIVSLSILSFIYTHLPFTEYSDGKEIFLFFLRYGFTLLTLAVIFFNAYLYINSSLLSLGGSFFILTLSYYFLKTTWVLYFPFAYSHIVSNTYGQTSFWDPVIEFALIYLISISLIGCWLFIKYKK